MDIGASATRYYSEHLGTEANVALDEFRELIPELVTDEENTKITLVPSMQEIKKALF